MEELCCLTLPKEAPGRGSCGSRTWQASLTTDSGLPPEVKVGDKVIYSKYGGTEIKIDGEEYLILRESDILAVK